MDATTLTAISTIALTFLVPIYWLVTWEFIEAWHRGEPIRYFAPIVSLLGTVSAAASLIWVVAFLTLLGRIHPPLILPPGVGLLVISVATFLPAPVMLWLLRLLRGRRLVKR